MGNLCRHPGAPFTNRPNLTTRHSSATELARQGASLSQLQMLLGHANAKSTESYIVLAGGAEAQRMIRDRSPDLGGTTMSPAVTPTDSGDASG